MNRCRVLLIFLTLIPLTVLAQLSANRPVAAVGAGQISWDPTNVEHVVTNGEVAAHIVFKVKNAGPWEVFVDDLQTSCECTLASLPARPWRLAPYETNQLDVMVDLRDKSGNLLAPGPYYKSVYVHEMTGETNLLTIIIIIPDALTNNPPPARLMRLFGQQMSAVDHQAVFKNDCVKCHLVPAFGKTGGPLFHATCGICHEATNRAAMVPDLHSLKTEIDANYWRHWVTDGKAGTLMPGFASTNGGPLDDAQINSLLAYLTNAFPRPVKTEAPNAPNRKVK